MHSPAVEVVVVDWDGPAAALAGRLARLLALGVDVVLSASAGTAAAAAALRHAGDGPGRLVTWPGRGDPVDWARHRLAGRGAPDGAVVAAGDAGTLDGILAARDGFPAPVPDPAWRLEVDGSNPDREREVESWLTVGNGRTGTRGSLEEGTSGSLPAFYVAGIYGRDPHEQAGPELVKGPEWTSLEVGPDAPPSDRRRVLDLRNGMLFRESPGFRSARFASLADRDVLVLRAEGATVGDVPVPEVAGAVGEVDADADGAGTVRMQGVDGGEVWFAISSAEASRLVAVDRDGPAQKALARASAAGADRLLARHRRAWRERWLDADVVVDGDGQAQRDLRFALYHLVIAGDPESDRASVGARALTGPGYRGHVFWDTEIFVLPFYVWTHPETARALLAYRHRTLPAARAKAARLGYQGALYAWESADTGEETTPEFVDLPDGTRLTILTGLQEHHIAADVAWAVWHYWQVTGDDSFVEEMGAEIVVETARFWASRTTAGDDGRLHICEVIGPDEYHEGVDDSAYTNVLARWNVRAAGALCDRFPEVAARLRVTPSERQRWEEVAGGLVVLFDPETKLYEQFDGFFDLENVRSVDLAPRPFTGELVVGVDRLRATQVVKQADVIMLGVLLPDEVGEEVQAVNYRHYEPRTSHGSSLSPAMHALVSARVGDAADALSYFHLAGGVDLDNRMGNAADGVHIATMGGLWQAAVFGFGGVRAHGDAVRIDPRVPRTWECLAFPVRWRGTRIAVEVREDILELDLDGPALVALGTGEPVSLGAGRFVARRDGGAWSLPGQG
ncbi:MAG TPA: glycosyl hydrolase family 65 protein [Acidimicrobiales bacterium]|nr:glycosyl hydrolase family 65 protein [Acidimicrobiales bacterium]